MLEVVSSSGRYRVDAVDTVGEAISLALASKPGGAFVLADATVVALHPDAFRQVADANRLLVIEATEEAKSYATLEPIIESLIQGGIKRNSTLVVVGGGVLQDIGCFIASVLFRGISWSLVPSTLLAQCDSCIGSKSSINVGRFKNQLGTFHAPMQVYLVFDLLRTLPRDEIRSGMGEIIKLHLVAGEDELARLKTHLAHYEATGEGLDQLVWDALRIKKGFIEQDEFDTGRRNLLNYGHTFGHAYESATQYGIPHGIAVSLGISTATFFSERLALVPAGAADAIDALLKPWYQPYDRVLREADRQAVFAAMKLDKKNTGSSVTCILTRGPGLMEKVPLDANEQVFELLNRYYERISVAGG